MGLTFNLTYDDSVKNAPAGFKKAVESAVHFLEHAFSDPITINLAVGFGEAKGQPVPNSALAKSYWDQGDFTYNDIRAALGRQVSSYDDLIAYSSLPVADPTSNSIWLVTSAQAKALGLLGPDSVLDGWVGLSSQDSFTYDPDNRFLVNGFDAVGMLIHEITEVMGRNQWSGLQDPDTGIRGYSPFDLYRYASAGVRALTPGDGYLSFDGRHLLRQFNNSQSASDPGDWDTKTVAGDAFGAGWISHMSAVTALDMQVMDIIGYHRAPSPHADLNGDAVADVLWRNAATGDTGYWAMNGGVATWQGFGQVPSEWRVVGTGDFNGDFAQDIVWYNSKTADVGYWGLAPGGGGPQWTYLGNGLFEWEVAGTGDVNGDARTDIIWHNTSSGDFGYWAMGGTAPTWNYIGNSLLSYKMQGVGDFDGNGRADTLWRNPSSGETGIFLMDTGGHANWLDLGRISFLDEVVGIGDFDGNGISDILWRGKTSGVIGFSAMDHSATPTWHGLGATALDFKVIAVADYNGDGSSDILWRNSGGMTGYWAMYNGQPTWHAMGDTPTQYAAVA